MHANTSIRLTLAEKIAAIKAEKAEKAEEAEKLALMASTIPIALHLPVDANTAISTSTNTLVHAKPAEAATKPARSLAQILAERKAQEKAFIEAREAETQATQEKTEEAQAFFAGKEEARTAEAREEETRKEEAEAARKAGETFSLSVELNSQQLLAKELAFTGKSFVLTGAAGTGKTTAQREIAAALLKQGKLGTHSFRIQGTGLKEEGPSIAFVAYTRVASGNLKRAIHKDADLEEALRYNITTVHNLLEYQPEIFWDNEKNRESMRFIPKRTSTNKLDITNLIIEEATMVDIPLWRKVYEAMRGGVQVIFIGDINQLQPVFGASVFNYALASLPVVELTQVYRQKEGSSILDNAHKILAGDSALIEDANFKIIRGGPVQHTQHKLLMSLSQTIPKWYAEGEYNPEEDIFLSPWNKQDLGTDALNKVIAQFLGDQREATVWEIVAGIAKLYLAEGDKVMYNKQIGIIKAIRKNGDYIGKAARTESKNLLRFGAYRGTIDGGGEESFELAGYENISLESLMEEEVGEKKKQASHVVELEMETGEIVVCSAVGDFSPQVFSLGYALTVHKAQGCEWRKVFFILHKDHSISAHRELLYTAVTRAREQCILITKDFMIQKAVANQKVKGNNILEKIAYFNAGVTNVEDVPLVKAKEED